MQELRFSIKIILEYLFFVVFITTIISCNNEHNTISTNPEGVGPITNLELTTINDSLMKVGQELFKNQCSKCHTMEYKNTGPDISDILTIRKPEWVMNFLLNKEEMLLKDSLAIRTRLKYDENCGATLTKENEAVEILEYLRIYQIWLHEFNAKTL